MSRVARANDKVGARASNYLTGPKQEFWKGVTGADGVVVAPETRLRNPRRWWEFSFIVTAEKDGDIAYVGSNWNEGISPWEFGNRYDIAEADPLLRGSVFSDRGVYRLGEEIHFKAILREDTPKGIALLASGRKVFAVVSDGEGREISRRALTVNEWSSTDWRITLPRRGAKENTRHLVQGQPCAGPQPCSRSLVQPSR